MTEIPEHLLKRAEEAKAKAAAKKAGGAPAEESAAEGDAPAPAASDSGIPAHLLERSRAAKERAAEGGAGESAGCAQHAAPASERLMARS